VEFSLKLVDLSLKLWDFPLKIWDVPLKLWDFPLKNMGFLIIYRSFFPSEKLHGFVAATEARCRDNAP